MKIDFSDPASWQAQLTHAYTRRFDAIARFEQRKDCIENRANPDVLFGYENISLISKEKFPKGTKLALKCAFDKYGAPLLMWAKDVYKDETGELRFDDYYEVVLWEKGINVWRLWHDGVNQAENGMTWVLLMGVEFEVAGGVVHTLHVDILEDHIEIEVGGHRMSLRTESMFDTFYVGIDACEGINSFYEMEVE